MLLREAVLDLSGNGAVAGAIGNQHRDMVAHGAYQCVGDDMWTAISVSSEDEWLGIRQAIGQPGLAFDPRLQERNTHRDN
tara:strand:- start:224 stop:463 length:240 start_codon:yes stop_codon:yes gene_type:complete